MGSLERRARGGAIDGSSLELAGNDVYASVLHEDGTGRSSGRRRTHLGTSLGQRWLSDGAGYGGADGGFLYQFGGEQRR